MRCVFWSAARSKSTRFAPRAKRFYWQGRFRIETASVLRCLSGPGELVSATSCLSEEIVLDFREALPAEAKAEEVHALWQHGPEYHTIAQQLGCGRTLVLAAAAM